jgi:hypothetical protein
MQMPRLVGKQSSGSLSVGLLLLITVGVLGTLEYVGVIDLIPNFGLERADYPGIPAPNTNSDQNSDQSAIPDTQN